MKKKCYIHALCFFVDFIFPIFIFFFWYRNYAHDVTVGIWKTIGLTCSSVYKGKGSVLVMLKNLLKKNLIIYHTQPSSVALQSVMNSNANENNTRDDFGFIHVV